MEFWIFLGLSVLTVLASALWARDILPLKQTDRMQLSPLKKVTVGVFFAAWLLFVPVCYHWDGWEDNHAYLRPVLLSVMNAFQIFLMGVDFDFIEKALPTDNQWLKVIFSLYGFVIYFTAPLLTFGNVLFLFENITGQLRLRHCQDRPVYVLSELNAQAVAMAESIKSKGEKSLIVFAGVSAGQEDSDGELLDRVRGLGAICLKKDAAHLEFCPQGQPAKIFLISENEAENTGKAIRLTERLKGCSRPVSVFVYSSQPATDEILDSLDVGQNLLSEPFGQWIKDNPRQMLYGDDWKNSSSIMHGNFMLRRIDPVDILVKGVLERNGHEDYQKIQQVADTQGKTISITILGMGRYGTHFLKTAVWFYQRFGYRLEFNIFDLGTDNGDPEKRIKQSCPELIPEVPFTQEDEAQYDIRFFTGVDCFGSDFDKTLLENEKDRFLKTNLVFVSLGEDDKDIRAAMAVRKLFERMRIQAGKKTAEQPFIYSVVYDDQKVENLNIRNVSDKVKWGLKDHRGNYYNIQFVGAHMEQYAYERIVDYQSQETDALQYHLDWVRKESQLRVCYEQAAAGTVGEEHRKWYLDFKNEVDRELESQEEKEPSWGDQYYFTHNDLLDYHGPVNVEQVKDTVEDYMRYSYYRQSSMAKHFHKKALRKVVAQPQGHSCCVLCSCAMCEENRKTEHMRWNAYMRSQGFCYHEKKKDFMAKLHYDLKPWRDLPVREKFKD